MTVTLPDDAGEWAQVWRERLDDDEAFAASAASLTTDFLCEIQPDDAYDGEPVRFLVSIEEGAVPAAGSADADTDFDVALRGPYEAWKGMLEDEINVAAAMMGNTFSIDGSKTTVMRYQQAFRQMIKTAQAIDTEYTY